LEFFSRGSKLGTVFTRQQTHRRLINGENRQ
jgi:hypothetical protein